MHPDIHGIIKLLAYFSTKDYLSERSAEKYQDKVDSKKINATRKQDAGQADSL